MAKWPMLSSSTNLKPHATNSGWQSASQSDRDTGDQGLQVQFLVQTTVTPYPCGFRELDSV